MKLAFVFLVFLALASGAYSQTSPISQMFLAKDDGLGNAGEAVEEFSVTDVPIYCVITLSSVGKATVKLNFIAESVPKVKADSLVFTKTYTLKETENGVDFKGRPGGKTWVAGKYRIEIFVDDALVTTKSFMINGSTTAPAAQTNFAPPKPRPVRKPKKP